jgi:tRNA U34 5-methylaminomethyl-2-thiouridine-forming methyltransferase MnmC
LKTEIIITADGSHTLYLPELDEHYHSTYGAINESRHIFIKEGFFKFNKPKISILEIGFGTGLNAFLTFIEANQLHREVLYTAVEKYPISISMALKLNYPKVISPLEKDIFTSFHQAEWNKTVSIHPGFELKKINADLTTYQPEGNFDLVYFDAFSPEKQPEMWDEFIFLKIFKSLNSGGLLTTYSSKGIIRRNLEKAGFHVEKIPGPEGKRHMTRAFKI